MGAQRSLGEVDEDRATHDIAALVRMSARQRIIGISLSAFLLCCGVPQSVSAKPDAQDGVGQIVQPATGTDRAVYVPIEPHVILPRFLGTWATRGGKCIGQNYTNRMELRADLAIIAGHALTVKEVSAEGSQERDEREELGFERAQDHAGAGDMVVGLLRSGETEMRHIHFWFSSRTGRLILEEVGKPRRAYVRCTI